MSEEHTAEKDVPGRGAAIDLLAGVRCQLRHGQIAAASCVNCRSWAEHIGVPFWAPLLAEIAMTPRPLPPGVGA